MSRVKRPETENGHEKDQQLTAENVMYNCGAKTFISFYVITIISNILCTIYNIDIFHVYTFTLLYI